MKPYNIYFLDFCVRLVYVFFSYFLCVIIIFNNINTFFLFETLPFLSVETDKRFIITQITQLFNTIWLYCIFFSALFIFPLMAYHVKTFFKTSWYKYQFKLYNKLIKSLFTIFLGLYFISHLLIIPNLLTFFLYWEIMDEYSLLRIEAEISLFFYIMWILIFKFTFSLILSIVSLIMLLTFNFSCTNYLYKLVQNNKKVVIFILLCFFFTLVPPDFIIQLFLTIISYLIVELFYLLICIKLYKKIQCKKNANNKTIIKGI